MAQLVLYGSTVADSTLPSACDLASSSGGAEVTATSDWSFAGNYGELRSQDGTFSGGSSIPTTPTGNGWIVYPGAGTFAAGNWSASFAHSSTTPSTVDFTIRFFNYESGIYVLLGSITLSSQTTTTGRKVFAFPATAMASLFIDTPQFLYVDLWEHDSAGLGSDGTLYLSSSSVAGVVNDLQITTSDFAAGGGSGRIDPTVFGSSVPDATLTTACDVAPTTGGIEASKVSTYTGSGNFGEVYSQGGNVAASASLPAGESGHGWLYQPGAGTFAAGNWSASFKVDIPNNAGSWNLRFSKYSAGSYTPIGTITRAISNIGTYTESFAATAMPAVTLGASDSIYFSLWAQDTSGIVGEAWTAFVSTTATFGVANDAQVSTSTFTPAAATPLVKPYVHFSIPRALGGTIIPLVINPPVIYEPRALGSTLLTDARIFIPRALGGTYVQDDPTLLWVPHALGGTTQVLTSVALVSTIHGTGLESTTLSLSTALAGTIPGVGTLTGTLTGGVTALVVSPNKFAASTTLSTANQLTTASGGTTSNTTTSLVGTATGWGEVQSQGNASAWSALGAMGTPTGHGWFLDPTTLDGQSIQAGIWTPIWKMLASATGITVTISANAYVYDPTGPSYTLIGSMTKAGYALTVSAGDPGLSTPSLALTAFATGTKLYLDLWFNITANTAGAGTTVSAAQGNSSGTCNVANVSITTPGFSPTASSVALTATLIETGTLTGALAASTALATTIPGTGTLTATFTEATALALTIPGVGTLTGTMAANTALSVTTAGVGTLTGTFTESTALTVTIPAVGTLTGTLSTSANVNLSVTIPAVGTATMAGAALSTALSDTILAVGVLNPVLSASIGLTATSIPAVGTIVGTLGASAPLSSTVAGLGTLSATMAESTSLTSSLSAVGTLAGTLTVGNSVSFTVTIPAVGTLTASAPGLKTALTVSIAALGTIATGATFSETLSGTTLVAVGILSGSASLAVILGATIPGAGTISAAYQVRTALSLQLMAVGALLGTLRVPATFFGPYSATERVSSKLASTHTVTSKSSQHVSSTYTATRK